ncbi:MAG: threonine synthase [Alphaproteobacteria bacterium]|nr:threonine synthase [Alphaproteobacteria bacterium]
MKFISTRGGAPPIGFEQVLLSGPAPDGGLYVPETWPQFTASELAALKGRPYAEIVAAVLAKFADEDWAEQSARVARAVYARFDSPDVAPLVELEPGRYLLELFHGPTLAFKDFALQLVVPLMAEALRRRKERALVLVATSGDTGAAAVAAIANQPSIDLVVLHPLGRISDIQRRQMTTEPSANVHNVAVEGTFDDAQALVKTLFADTAFARAHHLAAVNSINWVRIAAQVAYYMASCLRLGLKPLTFVVPTGNFGDVFAGFVAQKMGAPIARLVVATNSNDILTRAIDTGVYARGQVHATMSPAMDIQVASNFERLIFEAHGRDGATTSKLMAEFAKTGALEFSHAAHEFVRQVFAAASVDEHETLATMTSTFKATHRVVDPHTAVGLAATARLARPEEVVVTLATAHPAKFPDAVAKATGVRPVLPARLKAIVDAPERCTTLPNDAVELKRFIQKI